MYSVYNKKRVLEYWNNNWFMNLNDAVKETANDFNGVLGVSVKKLCCDESVNLNSELLFPTASVFKLPVIVEFYRQIEQGKLNFEQQVILRDQDKVPGSGILKELEEGMPISYMDLLKLMMIVSDNTATDLIVEKVGFDNINNTMIELGLPNTRVTKFCREMLFDLVGINDLDSSEMTIEVFQNAAQSGDYTGSWSLEISDNNVFTPLEMNTLLELIATNRAAESDSCEAILNIMSKCQTGMYRIPKYLPRKKVFCQRKTGSLPGIRNDVGIISINESEERYALSCFTRKAEDVYEAEEIIANISKIVYDFYTS
jgi:beta-lactamase class A